MDELEEIMEQASEIALENGAIDVIVADTPPKIKDVWAARSSFLEAIKAETNWKDGLELLDECDVVVPLNQITPYVEYVYGVGKKMGASLRPRCPNGPSPESDSGTDFSTPDYSSESVFSPESM